VTPPTGVQARPLDEPHPVWVEDVDQGGARLQVGYDGTQKLIVATTDQGTRSWSYDLAGDPSEEHPTTSPESLHAALSAFAAAPRPTNVAARPVIDPEREAQLRALGYIR
jgi:hypothetical protein